MMKEIWRNRAKYDEYFRLKGWYLSGDTAYKDKDGFLWFAGRADDVIKTAGERVGPFEVESALLEHPAVVESAVVSSPDADRGEIAPERRADLVRVHVLEGAPLIRTVWREGHRVV